MKGARFWVMILIAAGVLATLLATGARWETFGSWVAIELVLQP
jgi:hypothetical protein